MKTMRPITSFTSAINRRIAGIEKLLVYAGITARIILKRSIDVVTLSDNVFQILAAAELANIVFCE